MFPRNAMKKFIAFVCFNLLATLALSSPLPANKAFQISVKPLDPNTFTITWLINNSYFLYADRIFLSMKTEKNAQMGTLLYPSPETKIDKQKHTTLVYRKQLILRVPILGKAAGKSLLNLSFQGCADQGFCYPPEKLVIQLNINKQLALTKVNLQPQTKHINSQKNDSNIT